MTLATITLALSLLPSAGASSLPDISGPWALEIAAVNAAKVPVIGSVKSTSRTWILIDIMQDARGQVQDHRVCAAEVSGGLVKTRIPAGFVQAIAPKRYPIELGLDGRYTADTLAYQMGFDTSCSKDPPTQADDPCVLDADGDGHPGGTIHAKAPAFPWVEVYVAQQVHPLLDGRVVSVDRIEGGVVLAEMNTQVLGASNRLFASSPTVRPLSEESTFQMARLSEGAGCAQVLAHYGADQPPP